jgi:hypothetical protein
MRELAVSDIQWNKLFRRHLMRLSTPLGVLQNDAAPMFADNTPCLDLLQRSKATEAGKVIVQAAIADARGLSGVVDFTH